ncbi:hypothetical protein VTI74DRAFT_7153 [Chaetomium olivicolor]
MGCAETAEIPDICLVLSFSSRVAEASKQSFRPRWPRFLEPAALLLCVQITAPKSKVLAGKWCAFAPENGQTQQAGQKACYRS